jgi:23S rRNA pseudouridine955/2504/2580 synthase
MSWRFMSSAEKSSGVRLVQVTADREGQRLDNFLSAQLKGLPRSALYRIIRTGQVRINGKRSKPASRLEAGDMVRIPPARTRQGSQAFISERVCNQVRAAVLFEDPDLLVINKPSGMAVHPGSGLPWGLIDVVRQNFPGEYFELAHRLDRETSGCLVLARNGKSLSHLTHLFRDGAVQKHYLCLLDGRMDEALIKVDAALKKVQVGAERQMVVSEDGKAALTHFRLLQAYADCSYAEAQLLTGRTHQIRVHALHMGMPLAGDEKYASRESVDRWKARGLQRTFLHAQRLSFAALSGEKLEFNAPLPGSLKAVLDELEG